MDTANDVVNVVLGLLMCVGLVLLLLIGVEVLRDVRARNRDGIR